MAIKPRRYYQFVERQAENISLKWKVFHTLLFVLIAGNAFGAAYAFQHIFEMVNYSCILYAKPYFRLKDIHYLSVPSTPIDESSNSSTTEEIDVGPMGLQVEEETEEPNFRLPREELNFKVGNVSGVEVKNGEYWINNATLEAKIVMDVSRNVGTTMLICDSVLFTPLMTLVIALFFTAFLFICGRGGRGYKSDLFPQSWMYVYPILIVSGMMVIMSIVTSSTFTKGTAEFCAEFNMYTGKEQCTHLMNYFLPKEKTSDFNFFTLYKMSYYTLNIAVGLWAMQFVCVLLRMLLMVDFKLYAISVRSKKTNFPEEEERSALDVLTSKFGLIEANTVMKNENDASAEEATTMV